MPNKTSIPPSLPPSVEEAYRRKCIELKARTKEVEDVNDATRLRISRIKRQVDKLRLERAMLLEQLAKRTSTNVEDSDGSPSPPPTPKEKPLRIKRGHRKPSVLSSFETNPDAGSTFINQNLATLSPSSDAFPPTVDQKDGHHKDLPNARAAAPTTNGTSSTKLPKKPLSAFDLYAAEMKPTLENKTDDDGTPVNVEEELARGWKNLPEDEKDAFKERERQETDKYQKEKDALSKKAQSQSEANGDDEQNGQHRETNDAEKNGDTDIKTDPEAKADDATESNAKPTSQDEDVEMTNYDTDQGTEQADS